MTEAAAPARPGWTPAMTDIVLYTVAVFAASVAFIADSSHAVGAPPFSSDGDSVWLGVLAGAWVLALVVGAGLARRDDARPAGRVAAGGVPSGDRGVDEAALKLLKSRAMQPLGFLPLACVFSAIILKDGLSSPQAQWWPALVPVPFIVAALLRLALTRPWVRSRKFDALLRAS